MKRDPMAPDYTAFLSAVKGRIQTARLQAGRAVNRKLMMLYWDIGHGIVERKEGLGWGDAVVERFAADLRAEFKGKLPTAKQLAEVAREFLPASRRTPQGKKP